MTKNTKQELETLYSKAIVLMLVTAGMFNAIFFLAFHSVSSSENEASKTMLICGLFLTLCTVLLNTFLNSWFERNLLNYDEKVKKSYIVKYKYDLANLSIVLFILYVLYFIKYIFPDVSAIIYSLLNILLIIILTLFISLIYKERIGSKNQST
ncbi:hypothetical protein KFV05_07750 [Macrococcoides canis]|uniref:hypothetical protein n=1 Tax=Macrococcoides canis TaxID=1855823 RepID=UPI0020B8D6CE|nr:hypothetical protein [Macrococcus canis]UTH01612.1 hypothetical protein KFV05_07750 [Macrococcus canis]